MPRIIRHTPESFGQKQAELKPARGLGDVVGRLVKPIAVVLRFGCLDENNKLKPDSKCAERRDRLNEAFPMPRKGDSGPLQ